jgi:DNA (cytosine-5)-methyltransferase 1
MKHSTRAMPKQILVRNVPERVQSWIEDQRRQSGLSQQEVVLGILRTASKSQLDLTLPEQPSVETQSTGVLPFKFVDLFAGIGGFRIALTKLGGQCVFTSEWDKYAQKTYKAWFGETPHGDIRKIKPADIPDHDLLAAGFPCQPFSIAGVSKKNSLGRPHGFKCVDQGNLFFYLATIIEVKRPPVLFLENVKNLQSHDNGRTWSVIRETLEDLEYRIYAEVIDASSWVPQHRERVCIIGFDRHVFGDDPGFSFPEPDERPQPKLRDILEEEAPETYTLSQHLWDYLREYAAKHRAKGNGFGYSLIDPDGISRTLSARYYKDGSEILVPQEGRRRPRRLTPDECARLMGFDPERYKIVVSDTQAYRQFGNAVVPALVESVGREIVKVMAKHTCSGDRCLLKTNGRRIRPRLPRD